MNDTLNEISETLRVARAEADNLARLLGEDRPFDRGGPRHFYRCLKKGLLLMRLLQPRKPQTTRLREAILAANKGSTRWLLCVAAKKDLAASVHTKKR